MTKRVVLTEQEFNAVVAAWFDAALTCRQVAAKFKLTEWKVQEVWKVAKLRGLLPRQVRASDAVSYNGGNNRNRGITSHLPPDAEPILGYDHPITVGADELLTRLREHHLFDPRRLGDDMTAKLDFIAQSMSRGVRTGDYLA